MSRISLVRALVLVVHGERDAMVPPFFGRELAFALRGRGKVVEEHFGPRGSHSYDWGFPVIRGTAPDWFKQENDAFLEHLLDFLEKHVKRGADPD